MLKLPSLVCNMLVDGDWQIMPLLFYYRLWDHLSSNLHVYVQPKESIPEKATKAKPTLDVLSGKRSQEENAAGNKLADSENEREKLNKESRSRRNREWKGLVQEISSVPIQKSFTGSTQHEGKNHQRKTIGRRSRSPRLHSNRKRVRQEEELSAKVCNVIYQNRVCFFLHSSVEFLNFFEMHLSLH